MMTVILCSAGGFVAGVVLTVAVTLRRCGRAEGQVRALGCKNHELAEAMERMGGVK